MSKLNDIFKEVFKETNYTDQTEIMQFKEWDSMTHMFLITKIEETYNIQLSGNEIAMMRTIGQLKDILMQHGVIEL